MSYMRYFLYARKSTDDKDKQIHSIEDQVAVLRKLAKKEGLNIVEQFEERKQRKCRAVRYFPICYAV